MASHSRTSNRTGIYKIGSQQPPTPHSSIPPMTPEPLTQTFDGLGLPEFDSTGFLESFDTVINADVYQERVQNLERDEIALLVEYLDEVRHYQLSLRAVNFKKRRLSIGSSPTAGYLRSVCLNSAKYVAIRNCFRNHTGACLKSTTATK